MAKSAPNVDLSSVVTSSEDNYELLEPWMWVMHTGKTAAEHNIFRLGDIELFEYEQIFENLEANGIKLVAFQL